MIHPIIALDLSEMLLPRVGMGWNQIGHGVSRIVASSSSSRQRYKIQNYGEKYKIQKAGMGAKGHVVSRPRLKDLFN